MPSRFSRLVVAAVLWTGASVSAADGAPLTAWQHYPRPSAVGAVRSIASDGGHVFVGLEGVDADFPGALLVYDQDAGTLLRTIPNPTGNPFDDFGLAVAARDGRVAVGAPQTTVTPAGTAGAVYVFDVATGTLQQTLTSPDPPPAYDGFGRALAWIGGELFVGEPQLNPPITLSGGPGRIRVFDPVAGTLSRTFEAPPGTCCGFGISLAALGSDLLVGSPFEEVAGLARAGSAYRLDGTTGNVEGVYANPDPDPGELFGWSVGGAGTKVVVGAPFESSLPRLAWHGLGYLYDADTGALEHTFVPPDGVEGAEFGDAVAAAGPYVAFGTFYYDHVFVFDPATGDMLQHLRPSAPTTAGNLGFGSLLATDGGRLLVGNNTAFLSPKHPGGASLYDLCGNAIAGPLEQCDDGDDEDGDGCSSSCRYEACAGTPAAGCRTSDGGRASVALKQGGTDQSDVLVVGWRAGTGTIPSDFGNPLAVSGYAVCLYDEGPAPQPRLALAAPPGGTCAGKPCWKPTGTSGFGYRDKHRTPSGIDRLRLRAALDGRATLGVKGKGALLGLPSPPLTGTVTVQIHRVDGPPVCWQALFSQPRRNDASQYRARSD